MAVPTDASKLCTSLKEAASRCLADGEWERAVVVLESAANCEGAGGELLAARARAANANFMARACYSLQSVL